MAQDRYDAIVVGATVRGVADRDAARPRGYRVLVVDRATFPSDTLSTHILHPPGAAALQRWGLLDALRATGCPPIDTYSFDFGPVHARGRARHRRLSGRVLPAAHVLDKLLVDAASDAGAEVREEFTVEDVVIEDGRVIGIRGHSKGGETVTELADVVVGADGRYSLVAKAVGPEQYNERPPILCGYYTYWSDLPMDGRFEVYVRDRTRLGRGAHARRSHARRRRVAVRRARRQQGRRRRQLPGDVRAGTRVRRPHPRRDA